MPIAYLDVPTGIEIGPKRDLVKALYDALHEAFPFPDDVRIFLREWDGNSVSQNGLLGSEPARPVFTMHVPQGVDTEVIRTMVKNVDAAVTEAYPLPDFITFIVEYPLDLVALHGGLLSDDGHRVDEQTAAYA